MPEFDSELLQRVGLAQDPGTRYEGTQHDAISARIIPESINTYELAEKHLKQTVHEICKKAQAVRNQHGAIGSTLLTCIVTPDAHISCVGMGDSPLAAYFINPNGRVSSVALLNNLHNLTPYQTNIIYETAQMETYDAYVVDDAGTFSRRHDVNGWLEIGGQVLLVAASDGLIDSAKSAPSDLSLDDAWQFVREENQACLEKYVPCIEEAVAEGCLLEEIAQRIIRYSFDEVSGSDCRDNISVVSTMINEDTLSYSPIALLVADGFGDKGHIASTAVKRAFDCTISSLEYTRQLQGNESHSDAFKEASSVENSRAKKIIYSMPWCNVKTSDGIKALYLNKAKLELDGQTEVKKALNQLGVKYIEKRSSLDGGIDVFAVQDSLSVSIIRTLQEISEPPDCQEIRDKYLVPDYDSIVQAQPPIILPKYKPH